MEFYSKSQPNLILPKMKKTVYKIIKKAPNHLTVSEKVSNMMSEYYNSYIEPNKVVIFIALIIVLFLVYRYYNRTNTKDSVEKFSSDEYNLLKDITDTQTAHLRYDSQPTLNPLLPISIQQEPVYYPPDPLPVNIPDAGTVYTRNIYEDPGPYPPLNMPIDYDYNNVYKNSSRSYYNGTYNTYQNAQDTDIINPYGYLNNFNTSTGDFIGQMTEANNQNLTDYQSILDNTQGNLYDSLKIGPNYLNSNIPESTMDPPYATD